MGIEVLKVYDRHRAIVFREVLGKGSRVNDPMRSLLEKALELPCDEGHIERRVVSSVVHLGGRGFVVLGIHVRTRRLHRVMIEMLAPQALCGRVPYLAGDKLIDLLHLRAGGFDALIVPGLENAAGW